ncbi:probable cytochrome P450 6a14 [Bombus pyrosoma]|uniref:probable cytochrome P450 6a14 n=1 Tax=Bombus pyrosoma TaxID=396416 RepID=UPI001CB8D2FB|nr:probable cytochrome P450 6a14 [Bombus pyrosoma]
MDYFQLLFGIAAILLAIYYYYTSVYDTWKNRGVPGPKPSMFVGNFLDILLKRQALATIVRNFYNEYKSEPVFGIYEGTSPVLVINDLDLIKDVLIRDFSLFVDRGFKVLEKIEPLSQHLFLLEARRWRPLRTKLSPIFTSGKLKEMFPLIAECAGNLEKYLDKVVEKGVPVVECRDLAAKFTTDVIGSCAFGISTNALEDENSEFRRMGKQIFAPNLKQTIRELCRRFVPSLFKVVGYFLRTTEMNNFFINLVRDTMEYKKTNNITRPDFIYLLMQLKEHPEKMEDVELTDSLIAAQAFVFFIAGFETSSTTIAHALYELAQNQEIQDKLRQEIRDAYNKDGGTLTYEGIKGMKYLDKVFKETLRKYPILTILSRQAMENYTFKGTKITIPKETIVWIPIYGIQHDSNIYSDPEKFDPERFNEDAVAARHPMSYLSFGDGPRNCIGARFAHYQSKVGLATILLNHKVDVCEKTKIPYEPDKEAFLLSLTGGVNLKITRLLIEISFDMDYFQLLCGISVLLLAIYYHYSSCYNFWKSRNIPGPKPIIFIGNFLDVLLKRESLTDWTKKLYDQYKNEPAFGIYIGTSPLLIPNNLDMIKDVLIRDFSLFAERGFKVFDEKIEPIQQNLIMLEAERWRPLRAKLSPVFTSGKLKEMFPLIIECAEKLEKHLEKLAQKDEPVECRELIAKFGIDSIGSCVFGLNMNALENENSEFFRMSKQIFAVNVKQTIRDFCREFTPSLYKIIGSYLQPKEINDFFLNLFIDTMKYRMDNNIIRPDFVHLLMELKKHPDRVNNIELTDALLASQTFAFFIGGFETSSATMAHVLYELAQNLEIQDKLREEIRDVYDKNNGVLTYADIKGMKYLDKVLKETLRKYPPLPILNRQAMENYTFKDTKISIPKGTNICIAIYAIQNDSNVYPDPEKFDPERFNEDAVAARHPMSYLSFGDGPRNCIGARFAQYQSKIGLITILRNHRVDVCEKTKIPFESDNRAFLTMLKGGVYLKISKA